MLEEGRKKKSKEHQDVEESAMFNQVFKAIAKQVDVVDVNVTWDEFNAKREVALASARNAQDGEAIASPFEDAEVVE